MKNGNLAAWQDMRNVPSIQRAIMLVAFLALFSAPNKVQSENLGSTFVGELEHILSINLTGGDLGRVRVAVDECSVRWSVSYDIECTAPWRTTSRTWSVDLRNFHFSPRLDAWTSVQFSFRNASGLPEQMFAFRQDFSSDDIFQLPNEVLIEIGSRNFDIATYCGDRANGRRNFSVLTLPIRGDEAEEFQGIITTISENHHC